MHLKIAESTLTPRDADRLGFLPSITPPPGISVPAAGFSIPYFDLKGRPIDFFRFRTLSLNGFAAIVDPKKQIRYTQPAGKSPRVYFSPFLDWPAALGAPGAERAVILTEGENKANAACKAGYCCLGLGGVWNFKAATDSLCTDLDQIDWKGATAYIAYDSDARSNVNIIRAENALARELLERGAYIVIVRIPCLVPGKKTGIDDYLLAKGPEEFADLLATAAKEPFDRSRALHELNERYVFIRHPQMVLEYETLKRTTSNSFIHALGANILLEETVIDTKGNAKVVKKPAAKPWIDWPQRGEVQETTYKPGHPTVTGNRQLNLWPGWGIADTDIHKGDLHLWTRLLDYIFTGTLPAHRRWFEQWLAYPIQNPGAKMFTAVVVWGVTQGTGKTLIGHTLGRLYGRNFSEIESADLTGSFNEWAENKQFVMGDEITGDEKRTTADRMKSVITRNVIRINAKFIPTYTVPDCINYYFTSNHPDSFFIDDNDRRYFIHEVAADTPLPDEFYREYDAWYKSSAVGALLYHLRNVSLEGFNPAAHAPTTLAKMNMVAAGRSDLASWVAMLKEEPDAVLRTSPSAAPIKHRWFTTGELYQLYTGETANHSEHRSRLTKNGLMRELLRQKFPQVNFGQPVKTFNGAQRLWAVRKPREIIGYSLVQVAKGYAEDRAADAKALAEVKRKMGVK